MNEPESYVSDMAYVLWAQENKKRADRLLAAAKTVIEMQHDISVQAVLGSRILRELGDAAIDYEDKRG